MLAVNCKGKGMEPQQGTRSVPANNTRNYHRNLSVRFNQHGAFLFGGDPKLGQNILSRDCAKIYFRSQSTILRTEEMEAVRGDKAVKIQQRPEKERYYWSVKWQGMNDHLKLFGGHVLMITGYVLKPSIISLKAQGIDLKRKWKVKEWNFNLHSQLGNNYSKSLLYNIKFIYTKGKLSLRQVRVWSVLQLYQKT